ncbi:hypothetical protein CBL_06007 [Carabus blaptoides fortunei]
MYNGASIGNILNVSSTLREATIRDNASLCVSVAAQSRSSCIEILLNLPCYPALEQFKEGLNILGFLEKLKVIEEFKELMCYTDSKLTADEVSSIFKVTLSEIGSNNRNIRAEYLLFGMIFRQIAKKRRPKPP